MSRGPTHTRYKVSRFDIDSNLLYIIQDLTKESTEEILATLWENVNVVIANTLSVTKAQNLNEKIKTFYKKTTTIPMQIDVTSHYFRYMDTQEPGGAYQIQVKISFTRKMMTLKVKNLELLANEKLEVAIGLSDSMTELSNINKPEQQMKKRLAGLI